MPWYIKKMILRAKWVSKISFSDRLVQSCGLLRRKRFFTLTIGPPFFFLPPPNFRKIKNRQKKMKNKVIGGIMPWYVQKMILRAKWVSKISFSDRLVQSRGLLRRKRFFTLTIGLPFLSYPPKRMILTGGILTDPSLPTDFLRPQSRPQPFWCLQSPLINQALIHWALNK